MVLGTHERSFQCACLGDLDEGEDKQEEEEDKQEPGDMTMQTSMYCLHEVRPCHQL